MGPLMEETHPGCMQEGITRLVERYAVYGGVLLSLVHGSTFSYCLGFYISVLVIVVSRTFRRGIVSGFVFPRICRLLYVRSASLLSNIQVGPDHI